MRATQAATRLCPTDLRQADETDLIDQLRLLLCDYNFDRMKVGNILEELERRAWDREDDEHVEVVMGH